jgi:hypothetical protein
MGFLVRFIYIFGCFYFFLYGMESYAIVGLFLLGLGPEC